jgi:cephalosporin-C deacetylase
MALPWDERFRRASLDVPSFGNHAIRITRRSEGSGEAIRQLIRTRPEVLDTLQYFDSATAASYLHIPVHVGAALRDPAVDPRGQFSVYLALAGPKRLTVRPCGHLEGVVAEQADDLVRQGTEDFFSLPDERLPPLAAG